MIGIFKKLFHLEKTVSKGKLFIRWEFRKLKSISETRNHSRFSKLFHL